MLQKINVVVFDFDGTLSWPDSNLAFGKYCIGRSWRARLYIPVIGFAFLLRYFYRKGIFWRELSRGFVTNKMISENIKGFAKLHKLNRFGWAREQIDKERSAGNKVVLISASPDYLIKPLVGDIKFDAVLTSKMHANKPYKYEFLCWDKNKVVALDKWATENKYIPHVVRCYSDSKTDLPLMEIADEQVWINPKTGTRV